VRTRVTRIGRTVPQEFSGAVRAVWRKALAVDVIAGARTGGRAALVTLVRADVPMTAASMALQVSPAFEFASLGLCVGDPVSFDGGTLAVGSAAAGPLLIANASGAGRYDGTLDSVGPLPELVALESISHAARAHRSTMSGRDSFARAASSKCDALLAELAGSVARDDALAAEKTARALVGLGPGLTPSGDDALCGFMLARCIAEGGGGGGDADDAVRSVARRTDGRTTVFSAVQLGLAADRRFGEALLEVAIALGGGWPGGVHPAVARCLDLGATSGADALLGLVAGVRSAQPAKLVNAG